MIVCGCGAGVSQGRTREIVRQRSGEVCELCAAARATSMHHRRKQGRVWCPCNVLHVCGDGTTGCHGRIEAGPTAAKAQGWWVEPWLVSHVMPVWVAQWGWVLLDAAGDYTLNA